MTDQPDRVQHALTRWLQRNDQRTAAMRALADNPTNREAADDAHLAVLDESAALRSTLSRAAYPAEP